MIFSIYFSLNSENEHDMQLAKQYLTATLLGFVAIYYILWPSVSMLFSWLCRTRKPISAQSPPVIEPEVPTHSSDQSTGKDPQHE